MSENRININIAGGLHNKGDVRDLIESINRRIYSGPAVMITKDPPATLAMRLMLKAMWILPLVIGGLLIILGYVLPLIW